MTDVAANAQSNAPTAYDLAFETADSLEQLVNEWLAAVPEITTEEQAAKAADFDTKLLRAWQNAEKERKASEAEHQAAIKALQDLWKKGVTDRLTVCRALIKRKRDFFLQKKERLLAAERAEKARIAEEARRKAEEAARRAEQPRTVADVTRAQRLADEAAAAQRAAAAVPERAQVRGAISGRATSLRAYWEVTIEDRFEAAAQFIDRPEMTELLLRLGSAAVRAMDGDDRKLPGFKVVKGMK